MANELTQLTVVNEGGYQYDLMELPPKDSPGIMKAGKEILQDMQVDSIIQNLENVARLMFVAYNALGGTMVQAKMSGLQKNYLDLMDDSEQTIITFEHRSQEICVFVAKAYGWLIKGKEKMAVKQFDKCAKAAAEMAAKAELLADGFRKLSDQAEQVLESTQSESALQYKKMDEIKKQMEQYNANLAGLQSKQEGLDEAIREINGIYQDAKKKEKEAFDLKTGMMIVNAVTTCIKAFIPSGDSIKNSASEGTSQAAQRAQEDIESKEKEKNGLASQKKSIENNLNSLNEEKDSLEKEIQKIEQEIEVKNGNTTLGEEEKKEALDKLDSSLKSKEQELKAKQEEITKEEDRLESIGSQMKTLEDGIDRLNKQLTEYIQQSEDDCARAEAAAERALEKKLDMEKQRRETLASIQEFTVLIQSGVRQKNVAETAVQTLQVAIRCIKQVVVALATAAKFWRSMEDYCKSLASSNVIAEIEEINNDDDFSLEERLEYYQEDGFKRAFLEYICRWAALYYVCDDYKRRNNKVRDMVAGNIMSAASREEEWELAGNLASEMKSSIDKQVEDSDIAMQSLAKEVHNE